MTVNVTHPRGITILQKRLAKVRAAGEGGDTLLLLEHAHIYTLGRAAHEENLLRDGIET